MSSFLSHLMKQSTSAMKLYEVCPKSNETGVIKTLLNNIEIYQSQIPSKNNPFPLENTCAFGFSTMQNILGRHFLGSFSAQLFAQTRSVNLYAVLPNLRNSALKTSFIFLQMSMNVRLAPIIATLTRCARTQLDHSLACV